MAGIFDPTYGAALDPTTSGLLSAAFSALSNSGPSLMPKSTGQIIGQAGQAGLGAYQQASQLQMQHALQQQQLIGLMLTNRLNSGKADFFEGGPDQPQGAPAASAPTPPGLSPSSSQAMFGTPEYGSVTPPAAPSSSQTGTGGFPLVPGLDPRLSRAAAMGWLSPGYVGAVASANAPTDIQKMERAAAAGDPVAKAWIAKQNYIAPIGGGRAGVPIRNPLNPTEVMAFNPVLPPNVNPTFGPGGNVTSVSPIAGTDAAIQSAEAAKGRGQGENVVETIPPTSPTEQPRQMTRTQRVQQLNGGGKLTGPDSSGPLSDKAVEMLQRVKADNIAKGDTQGADAAQHAIDQISKNRGMDEPGVPAGLSDQQKLDLKNAEKFGTEDAAAASKYKASVNEKVQQGQLLMSRVVEGQKLLKDARTGGGQQAYVSLAKFAQAVPGVSQDIVDGIARGNLGSMEAFNKIQVSQAMESLRQAMASATGTGTGRITQAEFQIFQQANPNLDLDPRALDKIYSFMKQTYDRDFQEQQSLDKWIKDGKNPAQFQANFAAEMDKKYFRETVDSGKTDSAPKASFDSLPPPVQFKGKKVRDKVTGRVFTSDGMAWKQVNQ